MGHVDAIQDTTMMEQIVLNVDLIVPNAIMNLFVLCVMMDLLTWMKEVADVQMDFGMMGLPVNNAEITAKYV